MNKSQFLITIKLLGKSFFVILTGVFVFVYSIALIEKIMRSDFKNLPMSKFIIIGIILLILIFFNLKWIFGVFNHKNTK